MNKRLAEISKNDNASFITTIDENGNYIDEPNKAYLAKSILTEGSVTRDITKKCTMIHIYGSGLYGFKDSIFELISSSDEFKFEKSILLAKVIKDVLENDIARPNQFREFLIDIVKAQRSAVLQYTMPDGFPVIINYPKVYSKRINCPSSSNRRFQLSLVDKNSHKINRVKAINAITANVEHSLDAYHLRQTVTRLVNEGINSISVIHDCFGVPACYVGRLKEILKQTIMDIYKGDHLLNHILKQILPQVDETKLTKALPKGTFDINQIKEAEYAFS